MNSRLEQAYREPSSLVISGVQGDTYWKIATDAGMDKLLISYHYVQKKGVKWLRERMKNFPHVKLMIDSGAYTFHTNPDEYRDKPMEFWESYMERYAKFLHSNADVIFSCVNLDIANFVGQEKLDEWDEKYFKPLEEKGVLVCHVWHEFDGWEMWEEMCRKHRYVGFSLAVGEQADSDLTRMFNIARRYNTLVHGFAVTRVEVMTKYPFYTGDSTTWLVGTKYGELNWFDGRTMKRLKKQVWKRQYKNKFIQLGANWELAEAENPYELNRINLLVFKQAQDYIRKRVRAKQYWLNTKPPVREGTAMGLFEKTRSSVAETTSDIPKPKKIKKIKLTKGADEREDLKQQGKSKLDEFLEADSKLKSAPAKKKRIKISVRRPVSEKSDTDDLVQLLPDADWFEGDMEDYLDYAERCNISPDYSKEDIVDILWMMRVFATDDQKSLSVLSDSEVFQLAEMQLKEKFDSREKALEALKNFYLDNLAGKRSDFMEALTDAPPPPKEREKYLEDDDEVEIVDVTPEDLKGMAMLPPPDNAPMEEIEAYDEELRAAGIIAVRDEKGRFLKGQKVVRKPKQLYSKHFPKLACNTCYKAGDCPQYKPDSVCAYDKLFSKFDTRDQRDVLDALYGMANINIGRMQRLAMFEVMDGGMPDPALTSMIDQNFKLLMAIKQLQDSMRNPAIVAQQMTRVRSDGTKETITTVHNPGAGSILERIFMSSNVGKTDIPEEDGEERRNVIDVTPEE